MVENDHDYRSLVLTAGLTNDLRGRGLSRGRLNNHGERYVNALDKNAILTSHDQKPKHMLAFASVPADKITYRVVESLPTTDKTNFLKSSHL